MKIEHQFYLETDVVKLARNLLGKYLYTCFDGKLTGGMIIETEAYEGVTDRASHAYGNRRTARTEIMYAEGGVAYVYLCYGIHSLFNIVTNKEGVPHAVLIRGIRPVTGVDLMLERSGKPKFDRLAGSGPGKVSQLLGIHYSHSGTDLTGDLIWLEEREGDMPSGIISGPRIGVGYAGPDALLPYRFLLR